MLLLANGHQLRPACSRCSGRRLCVPVRLPSPAFTQLCQLPKRSTRTAATVVTAAPAPDNGPDDRAGSGQNASTSGRDSDAASSTSPGALTGPGTIANASSVAQLSSVADGASSSTPSGEGSRTPAVLIWIQSVFQAIQSFPAWVKAQNLQRLRDASDADAKDAGRSGLQISPKPFYKPAARPGHVQELMYVPSNPLAKASNPSL